MHQTLNWALSCSQPCTSACADLCTRAGYSTASVAWPAYEYRNAENALDMTCRLFSVQRLTGQMHSGAAMAVHSGSSLSNTCGVLLLPLPVYDSKPCSLQHKSQPSMMKEPPLLWAFLELVSNTSHKWCRSRTCQQYRYLSLFYQKRSK